MARDRRTGRDAHAGDRLSLIGRRIRRLLRSWRHRVAVDGHSMEPTLLDGDWLLVDPDERPALGDLAVARVGKRVVLKRVVDVDDAGRYTLASDNPDHAGQRLGPLEPAQVIGRPWFRYGPRRRFGYLEKDFSQ